MKAWAELFHIVNQTALKQFLKMGHIMIKSWSNMQFQGGNFVIFMGNMLQLTNVGIPQWRGQKTPSHAELPIKCSTIATLSNSHSPPSLAEDLKGVAHISKAWVVAPLASERISELQLSCAGGEPALVFIRNSKTKPEHFFFTAEARLQGCRNYIRSRKGSL